MKIDEILIRPLVTEKAVNLANNKVYMFETSLKANKKNIKESLEKLFKVKVKQVRIMRRKGKIKKVGRRMIPKQHSDRKVAFVQLSEGKIDLFPQA